MWISFLELLFGIWIVLFVTMFVIVFHGIEDVEDVFIVEVDASAFCDFVEGGVSVGVIFEGRVADDVVWDSVEVM